MRRKVPVASLVIALFVVALLNVSLFGCGREEGGGERAGARDGAAGDPNEVGVVAALEAEIALAEGDKYYLVLELDPRTLRLMHHGVLLHEMPVRSVAVGVPQVFFKKRSEFDGLFDRAWRAGRLDPARVRLRTELEPSDSTATEDPPIPPLPEELYPTPEDFTIHYPGHFLVEVVPADSAAAPDHPDLSGGTGIGSFFAALWKRDEWRLRLELPPEDLGQLYRSLPDSCGFLAIADH
ncbi:MAG: hypothetical protein R3E97_15880 [Candidatus Eisenbacteria bacterium]